MMMIRQHMGADEELLNPDDQDFVKKGTDGPKQKHETLASELENPMQPGLNPMKQVESSQNGESLSPLVHKTKCVRNLHQRQ